MTRVAIRRLAAVAAGAAAVLVLGAVPALAKTSPPEKWGATFCGSLTDWSDEVTDGAAEIQDSLQGTNVTPVQGKAVITGYIGDIGDATNKFYTRVKKAGNPDATNGAKIQKAILQGIQGIETRVGDIEALSQNLPTTDVASFQTSVQALSAAFDTVSQPFDQAMDKVTTLDKGDALSGELQNVKACRALFG